MRLWGLPIRFMRRWVIVPHHGSPEPGKQFRRRLTLAGEDKRQMAVRHLGTGGELAQADLLAALTDERQDVCRG